MTPLETLRYNILALNELVLSVQENRQADKDVLNLYQGFGNAKEILFDPEDETLWAGKTGLRSSVKEVHNLLNLLYSSVDVNTLLNSIKSSSLTAYYTPTPIIESISQEFVKIFENQNQAFSILEPSSGKGDFIRPFINHPLLKKVTGIEKDPITELIQEKLFEGSKLTSINSGFEKYSISQYEIKSKYDLVISNIPFGPYKVFDSEFSRLKKNSPENLSQNKIHTYFFERGIDKIKKNRYLAFITSSSISDSKSNEFLRKDMLLKCELLSATRLPNNTFDDTKVVTDLIVLKKRPKPLKTLNELTNKEIKYLKTTTISHSQDGVTINRTLNSYFIGNNGLPNNNVIGTTELGYLHDKQIITFGSNLSVKEIASKLQSNLSLDLSNQTNLTQTESKPITQQSTPAQLSLFDEFVQPSVKPQEQFPKISPITLNQQLIEQHNLVDGNVFVYQDLVGKIEFSADGPILSPIPGQYDKDKLTAASNVLLTYKKLVLSDSDNPSSQSSVQLRKELNTFYDQFEQKYGPFSLKLNKDVCQVDTEGFKLKGLEVYNKKISRFIKSDIFDQQSFEPKNEKISLQDAINLSLNNFARIDVNFITSSLKATEKQVIEESLKKGLLYLNPITNSNFNKKGPYQVLNQNESQYNFVPKDEFLSGPIRFKIQELEENGQKWFSNQEIIHKSITLLKSADIPQVSIDDLDAKLGETWIPTHHFSNFANQLLNTTVSIQQNKFNSSFIVSTNSFSHENDKEFAVKCKNGNTLKGEKLLSEALHGSSPVITYSIKYSDGSKQTFIDREAMSAAQMKIDTIHTKWREYVISNENISTELFHLYNNTQNINVERVFDGSHLSFPGINHFKPYKHQKDGVYQILIQNGCLIDHIVGGGKTLLFCTAAMEMQRLNIARKPMITALKANTQEIYRDFMLAYPQAKVLCPSESDFTPAKRLQFFQKIQNNNWDAVIMTHDQFLKIPQSREIQLEVLNSEITNLRLDLNEAKNGGLKIDKRVLKGLETRIENKTTEIEKLSNSILRDPNLLTFDKMGIDHLIVDESHEFKNLEFTTRHNRVAGLGSPTGSKRALNMLFAVRTLQNIHQGDKGITFCSGTPISNSLIELYLIKKYLRPNELSHRGMSNFDSWARSYAELSRDFEITITNEVKPKERFRSFQKVPELARFYRSFTNVANDNNIKLDKPALDTQFVEIESSPLQQEYASQLINSIQTENFEFFGKSLTESQLNAKMLIATTLSTKMSLDMRILDPSLNAADGSKVLDLTQNVSDINRKFDKHKGTQLIFCDTSTPTSPTAKEFNIYDGIKNELIYRHNIPEEQIAFIHDFNTDKKRKELFSDINSGKIRIALGSTKKMGVGVNVQKRCVALHHVDIPLTPKDIEQRDGRGSRQGNTIAKLYNDNKVQKFVYATKGTLDAYRYYVVTLKQNFINQIKSSNITFRSLDEGDMDQDGSMSPAAFIARLSGKEELLEKNKIDKEIQELETRKNALFNQFSQLNQSVKYSEKVLPLIKKREKDFQIDLLSREKAFKLNNDKKLEYTLITNTGASINDPDTVKEFLSKEISSRIEKKEHKIGSIGDFDLIMNHVSTDLDNNILNAGQIYIKSKSTDIEHSYGNGIFREDQNGMLYRYPFDCLKNLEHKIEDQKRGYQQTTQELSKDKELMAKIDHKQFDQVIEPSNSKGHNRHPRKAYCIRKYTFPH